MIGASAVGGTILSVSASMFGPGVTDHLPHFDYRAEGVNIEEFWMVKQQNKSVLLGKSLRKGFSSITTNIPAIALSTGNVQSFQWHRTLFWIARATVIRRRNLESICSKWLKTKLIKDTL